MEARATPCWLAPPSPLVPTAARRRSHPRAQPRSPRRRRPRARVVDPHAGHEPPPRRVEERPLQPPKGAAAVEQPVAHARKAAIAARRDGAGRGRRRRRRRRCRRPPPVGAPAPAGAPGAAAGARSHDRGGHLHAPHRRRGGGDGRAPRVGGRRRGPRRARCHRVAPRRRARGRRRACPPTRSPDITSHTASAPTAARDLARRAAGLTAAAGGLRLPPPLP